MHEIEKDDIDSWLQPSQIQKEKKVRFKDPAKKSVPNSVILRTLEKSEVYNESRVKNRLYASSICCPDWSLIDELIEFWSPPSLKKAEYLSDCYMNGGNVKHEAIQEHLFHNKLNVLHPICAEEKDGRKVFAEPRIKWGPLDVVSGKIDLVTVDAKHWKALDKGKESKIDHYIAVDIKETGESQWKGRCAEDLGYSDQKYRGQVSIYIDKLYEKGIGHKENGAFMYADRNSPKNNKLFEVKKDEKLLTLARDRANMFIEHVVNKKLPESDLGSDWIAEMIETQQNREWPEYAGVNSID